MVIVEPRASAGQVWTGLGKSTPVLPDDFPNIDTENAKLLVKFLVFLVFRAPNPTPAPIGVKFGAEIRSTPPRQILPLSAKHLIMAGVTEILALCAARKAVDNYCVTWLEVS